MTSGNLILRLKLILIFIISIISIKIINSNDEKSNYSCAKHTEECKNTFPYLSCCDRDDMCKRVELGALQYVFRCIKEGLLEDSCESFLDCQKVDHAICTEENKCGCQSNFIAVNNSKCMSSLNEFCFSDSDCLTINSTCKNSRCQCKFDFRPTLSNECEPKKLFKFCRNDEGCQDIIHAKCTIDNECVCRSNNVAVNDSCLPAINSFCWQNEPCAVKNAVCINSECKCRRGFQNIRDKFCARTYIGMPCKYDIECADIRNSECYINRFCDCIDNAMKLNETFCAPLLGGYCFIDEQCVPDNSVCVNNRCQCKTNFASMAQYKCVFVPLGKFCVTDSECRNSEHRECSRYNQCACKPNHIFVNDSICLPVLEGLCTTSDECQTKNSYCIKYRCHCKPGFLAISDDLCIPNDSAVSCKYQVHCHHFGNYGTCSSEKICGCLPNTKLYNNICWPIVGGSCNMNNECFVEHSQCINNTCACTNNFFSSSKYNCQEMN